MTRTMLLAVMVLTVCGNVSLAATTVQDEQPALLTAAARGQSDLVQQLLDSGVDPNVIGENGITALMLAAWAGHVDVVRVLLASGGVPNPKDHAGATALMGAARRGHTEVVKLLLDNGADPSGETFLAESVDERPVRLSGPLPRYPERLHQDGIEGTVLIEFVIDTMGRVKEESILILRSTNPAFEAPTREVIRQSLYSPGRVRGRAVRVLVSQQLSFNIRGGTETFRPLRFAVTGEREITPSSPTLIVTDSAAVDEPPRLLASPPLQYPDVGIEGVVVLEFVIDTTGHAEPSSITVIESPYPAFSDLAKDAVLVSVYSPGRTDGVPVAVRVRESLTFRFRRQR